MERHFLQVANSKASVSLVDRDQVRNISGWLKPDIEFYATKSPHVTDKPEDVIEFLSSPEGDELIVFGLSGKYAGFLTFRVQDADGERWGTIGMILMSREAQEAGMLREVTPIVEAMLRDRGCTVMNYMTKRKGFARLAPQLGLRPRLVEYMKEL